MDLGRYRLIPGVTKVKSVAGVILQYCGRGSDFSLHHHWHSNADQLVSPAVQVETLESFPPDQIFIFQIVGGHESHGYELNTLWGLRPDGTWRGNYDNLNIAWRKKAK